MKILKKWLQSVGFFPLTADDMHTVNCSESPYVPSNYVLCQPERKVEIRVASHNDGGVLRFRPSEMVLEEMVHPYKPGQYYTWSGGVGLNSCMLHYLYRNTHLIPEGFKGKMIVFPGTIYEQWAPSEYYLGNTLPGKKYPDFVLGLFWRARERTFYSRTDSSFHYGDTDYRGRLAPGWSLEQIWLRDSKDQNYSSGFPVRYQCLPHDLVGGNVKEYTITIP